MATTKNQPSSAFGTDPKTGNLPGAPSSMPSASADALARQIARDSLNPKFKMTLPEKLARKG